LLVIVPLLSWLRGNRGPTAALIYSSTSVLHGLGRSSASRAGKLLHGLLHIALAILIIALARPQLGKSLTQVEASGIDIMIALDVSGSMLTKDFTVGGESATRVDAIREVTRKFIEGRPNDRIGIIAFAGRPYIVSPLTLDHDWLLLTDGENNAGKIPPNTAAEAIKALRIKLYAIGAGINGIAPVPIIDRNGPVTDAMGNIYYQNQRVEFNEAGLKEVAQIAGGQFFRATDTNSLEQIYTDIDKMEKSTVSVKKYQQYRDLFPVCLMAGAGVLLAELLLSQTIWKKLP